jgi:hypothetical protein
MIKKLTLMMLKNLKSFLKRQKKHKKRQLKLLQKHMLLEKKWRKFIAQWLMHQLQKKQLSTKQRQRNYRNQ